MEKLDSTVTPASPLDLPRRSSSSSSSSEASSPDCASVRQNSPVRRRTSPDASSQRDSGTEDRGRVDSPASSPVTQVKGQRAEMDATPALAAMDADEEEEARGGPASTAAQAASGNRSPILSSPPPLLPAPAKTPPCPVPPTTSTASLPPSSSSSSPLPPHIPVISLGHSKPPLPLGGTPLTALHPIPNLFHGPHGDLRRSQMTCLPVGHPGSSAGSGGPPAPSSGPLFPQPYLSAHPLFAR